MKKFTALALTLGLTLGAGDAFARSYGMAGCGLGSVIIGADGFLQIFAATTNGTFASQTFGITTGTSNCVRSGVVMADKEQEAFFESNYDELSGDIARGGGEHLEALSGLFGCSAEIRPVLFQQAQASYETIFPSERTTPIQALYLLKVTLSQDDRIAAACVL